MSEEQKPQEEVSEEKTVEQEVEQKPTLEELLKNREAELARKNAEMADMRIRLAQREVQPKVKDPNDMTTWPDHELKAVKANPQYAQYHGQVEEILLDRKLEVKLAQRMETEKRVSAEMQLRQKFPEALNPSSELAVKMEQIMTENDLSKTPAGRLVAAKLASAELNQDKNTSDVRGRNAEKARVARVKDQMVDGDRPKSTNDVQNLESKRKDLAEKLLKTSLPGRDNEDASTAAMSEIIQDRFGGRKGFFGDR